jgi:WD40 repeat protein/Flp pilus assembly protein TadD/tRNA A-37 threonylcarbamoyl transferase component Bud32
MHLFCPHCQTTVDVDDTADQVMCPACGSSFCRDRGSTTPYLPTRTRLGKFELVERVGQGACGTVYKARDLELDRTVAIKVPRAGNLIEGQELDRFLREARSVAQLRHPSIIPVHEVGQQDGFPYLVSDFVDGVNLTSLLSGRQLPPRKAAEVVATIADALQYAHEHGVIHRDVKPSNIMLDTEGRAHIMDFGMAKREAGEVTMTIEGQVLGTPAFMSPEQAGGESHKVDGRTDVYSLGAVLYQLLTEELPFRGNARMLLYQVRNDEPRPPRSLNDTIPRDLQTICLKAMAKAPGRRYATARELADDLRRYLRGEPILARPVSAWEKGTNWARRRPAVASLSAAIVGVTVLAFALVTWQWLTAVRAGQVAENARQDAAKRAEAEAEAHRQEAEARAIAVAEKKKAEAAQGIAEREQKKAEAEQIKTEQARQAEAEERRNAEVSAYYLRIALAYREWLANNIARAEETLNLCPPEYRGWEWNYLKKLCHPELLMLPAQVSDVAFSPDGSRLVTTGTRDETVDGKRVQHNEVKVWNAATGREIVGLNLDATAVAFTAAGTRLMFMPDGKRLIGVFAKRDAAGGKSGLVWSVQLWDAATGEERLSWALPEGISAMVLSPDGKRLTTASGNGAVRVWDTTNGQELDSVRIKGTSDADPLHAAFGGDFFSARLCLSLDGKRLAAPTAGGAIRIWDTTTGKEVATTTVRERDFVLTFDIQFSPDGKRIAVSGNSGVVQLYDAATGQPAFALPGGGGFSGGHIAFSPDGRYLGAAGPESTVKVWDIRTGQEFFTLRGNTSELGHVHMVFSPDGFRLATISDGFVKIWDATTEQDQRAVPRNGGMVKGLAFSPDGRMLASACEQALNEIGLVRVNVYDVLSGQFLNIFRGHTNDALAVVFDPSGKRVVSGGADGAVRVWEPTTLKIIHSLRTPLAHVTTVAVSADGKYLAGGGMKTEMVNMKPVQVGAVRAWDSKTGEETFTVNLKAAVDKVIFTPEHRVMAVAKDGSVTTWDPANGNEVARVELPIGQAYSVLTLSPDGKRAGSVTPRAGNRDGRPTQPTEVKVWDTTTGTELITFKAGLSDAIMLVFTPDGKRLAYSGGARDRSVRIWDVATGHETLRIPGVRLAVTALAFSPDGSRLAFGGFDPTVRILDAEEPTATTQAAHLQALEHTKVTRHMNSGLDALQTGQGFAALFHLNRAVDGAPDQARVRAYLAYAYADLGDWDQAAKDYAKALELGDVPVEVMHQYALTALKRGDRETYRKICARILSRSDKVGSNPQVLNALIWVCALGPDAVDKPDQLVDVADKAVKAAPKDYAIANTLGAVLYRAGKFDDAVKQLNAAIKLQGQGGTPGDWLFLAMAHHRLGDPKAAKKWLDQSAAWLDRVSPEKLKANALAQRLPWDRLLEIELLRREAQALLKAPEGEPKNP